MSQAEIRNDEVICPNCVHHFVAISPDDQAVRAALRAENERLRAGAKQALQCLDDGGYNNRVAAYDILAALSTPEETEP